MLRRLLRAGLVAVFLTGALNAGCRGQQPHDVYVPPPGVDVRQYDLELQLDPETRRIEAQVNLHVRHPDTLTTLALAFGALDVHRVQVGGDAVDVERSDNRLLVPLDGDSSSTVEVAYAGVPETGLYEGSYKEQRVVYTDSWPERGRGWLPAVHHPSDPAALDLTLTVPIGYEAVGTGLPVAVDTLEEQVRSRFELRNSAPTYAFAFAVGDFAVTDVAGLPPIQHYLLPSDSAQVRRLQRTPQMLDYFAGRLGSYDYEQYATVQVPISFAGMENAATGFLQASLFDASAVERVQAHEVAHQWYGNRVVIARWRDLWLSEGMATYLTSLFYEHADGFDQAREEWIDMATDADAPGTLVPSEAVDPDAHLTTTVYNKGASVLHLLRLTLGDEIFFKALRTVYSRYAGRPLSTEAFQGVLEEVSGRDLSSLFDYWVYGSRQPVLRTRWEASSQTLRWAIEGDNSTLAAVPFELQVQQGNTTRYVDVRDREVVLDGAETPVVRPVGIMMRVE